MQLRSLWGKMPRRRCAITRSYNESEETTMTTDKLENALAFARATAVHASGSKQLRIEQLEAENEQLRGELETYRGSGAPEDANGAQTD